jgi:hypothetical protein
MDDGGQPIGSKYVAMDRIGRGAMGQVYAGRERDSGDDVAIKVLRSELGDDPEFVTRFLQERALLVGLRNANLVRVRDLVAEGDTLAIVMELVKGQDLRRFVGSSGTLPPAEAASLCADVLAGLASAHSAGIVHRDVKPENVIIDLTDPTRPIGKVTDFGIARTLSGPTLTRLSGLMGTPEYMAPELAENERATGAVDVYAVGIMCFELCAGRTPFAGGHPLAVLRRHADETVVFPDEIPELLRPLLHRMLSKRPEERPEASDAQDELRDLAAQLAGVPAAQRSAPDASASANGTDPDCTITVDRRGRVPVVADEARVTRKVRRKNRVATPTAAASASVVRSSRRRPVLLAAVAVIVVAAVGVGVLTISRHGGSGAAATPTTTWTHSFAPFAYVNGVLVGRDWTLTPDGKQLGGTYTVTNPTKGSVTQTVHIAVPKVMANTVDALSFTPAPDQVVKPDPVVAYRLTLPAGGTRELRFDLKLARRPDTSTLNSWIDATEQLRRSDEKEFHTPTRAPRLLLKLAPIHANLDLGGVTSQRLVLTGKDGTSNVLPALIATASWASSDSKISTITTKGVVTAVGVGTATVTARIGNDDARASITVTDTRTGSTATQATAGPHSNQVAPTTGTGGFVAGTTATSGPSGFVTPTTHRSVTTTTTRKVTPTTPKPPSTHPRYNADINKDGRIDCADYAYIGSEWGQTGPNLPGDVNHDGMVGQTDDNIWVSQRTDGDAKC